MEPAWDESKMREKKDKIDAIAEKVAHIHPQIPSFNLTPIKMSYAQQDLEKQRDTIYIIQERPIDKDEIKRALKEYEREKARKSCYIITPILLVVFVVYIIIIFQVKKNHHSQTF